jgi:hypothetical protein
MDIANALRTACDKNQGIKRRKWVGRALAVDMDGHLRLHRDGQYEQSLTVELRVMELAADDWETTMLIPYRVPA